MTPRTSLLFILFFSCTSLLTTVLSEMKPLKYFPVPYKENCAFPFSYQGESHTDCITDKINGNIPWCSMTSDYKGLITYCFDFRKTTLQCSDTYKINGNEYSGCNYISRSSPYKQCGTNETVKYRYCTDALDSPTLPSMINRDKCDPVYKNLSMDHTMCFGPSPYGFVVPITDEERDEILFVHNDYRSRVSSRYMFKLYWDTELAKLAQAHTNLCAFEHDLAVNRMSPKFNWKNGQNIAMSIEIRASPASLIESMLFDEEQNFHYGKNCAPDDNTCLHYTQAMISNLTRVGCGQTHCVYPDRIERLVTCNYIQSQYEDNYRTPYVQSDVPAIDCPLHADNGLCDCGDIICEFDKGQYIDPATCTCKSSNPQRSGRSVDLHEERMAIKNGNLPGFSKRNLRKRSNK